jgi:hypothetical protein
MRYAAAPLTIARNASVLVVFRITRPPCLVEALSRNDVGFSAAQ